MKHSIFITPSFMTIELGFLVCTAAAAYELFIGDFIWSREEEERRNAEQNARGRGMTQRTLHSTQRHYHRSLSPGRGGRGRSLGQVSKEEETTSLLQGRRYPKRLIESNASEEESFPSPGDLRSLDAGRGTRGGSAGDSTRRLFYKLVLMSLSARLLLIPVEFYCFERLGQGNNVSLRILLRMSQTLPHIAFASPLGLLVIFCAQISFAALPPLSPSTSDESDDEEVIPTNEVIIRDSIDENEEESPKPTIRYHEINRERKAGIASTIQTSISRLLRSVLTANETFSFWNFMVCTSYSTIFILFLTKNGIPVSQTEIYLWLLLTVIYSILLIALLYVGILLLTALSPGLKRRKDSNALAIRLLGTCALLAWIFIERIVSFAVAARTASVYKDSHENGEYKLYSYRRDALDYVVSELLPVLCLLFIMRRRRRGIQPSDVLIIHSFISNVFGSMGVLSASEEDHGDSDVAGTEGGTLGSRRFQSYGGSKQDSFPPGSVKAVRMGAGIGRVASSSGPPPYQRT